MEKIEILEKIKKYFEENSEVFESCIEELDGLSDYLSDDRYYHIDELPELTGSCDQIKLLNMAYFGSDEESGGSFNPTKKYFKFNAYGNLVSSNHKNYDIFLDAFTIEKMAENHENIGTIEEYEELSSLFCELEMGE